jgi:hypothetical protein
MQAAPRSWDDVLVFPPTLSPLQRAISPCWQRVPKGAAAPVKARSERRDTGQYLALCYGMFFAEKRLNLRHAQNRIAGCRATTKRDQYDERTQRRPGNGRTFRRIADGIRG